LKVGGKVRYRPDGTPSPMIAIPTFSYKSHIAIDRRYGFIRSCAVTSASHGDGRMLRHVVRTDNVSGDVWADSAYRSKANEAWLSARMLRSQIHRRKPKGRPTSAATSRANGKKSSIRARVEHVFANQKSRYGLFLHTIGLARDEAKLTLANIA
jgi:IS5 family transposase